MASFCAQCGTVLKLDAKFCGECGMRTSSSDLFYDPEVEWATKAAQSAATPVASQVYTRKLSQILTTLGAILTFIACTWWAAFYGAIAQEMPASLGDFASCLYSNAWHCALVGGLSSFGGKTPYNPLIFWIGAVTFTCGIIIKLAQNEQPNMNDKIDPLLGI